MTLSQLSTFLDFPLCYPSRLLQRLTWGTSQRRLLDQLELPGSRISQKQTNSLHFSIARGFAPAAWSPLPYSCSHIRRRDEPGRTSLVRSQGVIVQAFQARSSCCQAGGLLPRARTHPGWGVCRRHWPSSDAVDLSRGGFDQACGTVVEPCVLVIIFDFWEASDRLRSSLTGPSSSCGFICDAKKRALDTGNILRGGKS